MRFRHLDYASGTPVSGLGTAALDDLLERGDLEAWTPLLRVIARDPWSETAETILRLGDDHPMYGTSLLWRHWIERMRRQKAGVTGGLTLAQARVRAGLSQSQVARRLGISQADVSKLERRADLRLSTLRAFAGSIGARLYVALQGADDHVPRPLVLPDPSRARTLVSPAQGGSA